MDWSPEDVDVSRPAPSRMYDYLLGGGHNFEVDRAAVDQAVSALPFLPAVARANRAFLGRVVRHLAEAGVDQFLDLGSGIPTAGNVHEVAQEVNPGVHTVYVDIDPIAVAHAGALLRDQPHTEALCADLRRPRQVLDHPAVTRLIDWGRPVGLLMVAVLHFIPESDRPQEIVAAYRRRLASGSALALSHATLEGQPAEAETAVSQAVRAYRDAGTGLVFRTREEIAALLAGFIVVPPGIVPVPCWRPRPDTGGADVELWRSGLAALAEPCSDEVLAQGV